MRRYSPWRAGDLRGERGGSGCLGVRHHLVVPGVGAQINALGPGDDLGLRAQADAAELRRAGAGGGS